MSWQAEDSFYAAPHSFMDCEGCALCMASQDVRMLSGPDALHTCLWLPSDGSRGAQAIVSEFSPATASPMGLPWEAHERCRASLEAQALRDFFVHAVHMAQEVTSLALQGLDDGVCAACISLISAILTWEFRWPTC